MKILIILSLAAICLAKSHRGFQYPSGAKAVNSIVFESENHDHGKSSKSSEESGVVLSNPSRRDVKLGTAFAVFGFHGHRKPDNSGEIKNKSPEQPVFIENTTQVLEKGTSSSSEESQAAVDKQEKSSSSEESSQSVSKSESSSEEANAADSNANVSSSEEANAADASPNGSSSEENEAAAVNQDDSSSEENNSGVAEGSKSSSEEINPPNADQEAPIGEQTSGPVEVQEVSTQAPKLNEVFNRKENQRVPFQPIQFIPRIVARDVHVEKLESAKKGRVRGRRPLRSTDLNLPELDIKPNVQGPQGGIETTYRRVRRPSKQ